MSTLSPMNLARRHGIPVLNDIPNNENTLYSSYVEAFNRILQDPGMSRMWREKTSYGPDDFVLSFWMVGIEWKIAQQFKLYFEQYLKSEGWTSFSYSEMDKEQHAHNRRIVFYLKAPYVQS